MTKTALFAGLAAFALAGAAPLSAAWAAQAPVCKPATLTTPNPVPPGGGANAGRDASRAYSVTAIPGVVAAGAAWTKVWQKGGNSADGMVPDKDGAVLFAGEDFDTAFRVDAAGKETQPITGVGGPRRSPPTAAAISTA